MNPRAALTCAALAVAGLGWPAAAGRPPAAPDAQSLRAVRDRLPGRFRTYERPHFVIMSDAGRRWARARGDLLEATHRQVLRFAARLELEPHPLPHKLVCVLFRERAAFRAYARDHDGVTATWCLGYYSPRNDRTVFFNVESDPDTDEFAEARAIATTVHEAVHHLLFESRILAKGVQYPLWSAEGLATAFETSTPGADFGPDRDFRPRRERFDRLLASSRLIPLRSFVQLDRMPDDRRETVHVVYNQAYGLVTWLARRRPEQLRAYLLLMQQEPAGRPVPRRHLELFEGAFGDVDDLEREWLAWGKSEEETP